MIKIKYYYFFNRVRNRKDDLITEPLSSVKID